MGIGFVAPPSATGVTSFNGRTGAVVPMAGDYSAADVGALALAGGSMTGNIDMGGNNLLNAGGVASTGTVSGNSMTAGTFNGVALTTGGSAVAWLNGAGGYTAPVAADISFTVTYSGTKADAVTDVAGMLNHNHTNTGTAGVWWSEPTLALAAPISGATYEVTTPTLGTAPFGGAPINLLSAHNVSVAHPGSVDTLGTVKMVLIGDFLGALITGEAVLNGLTILNTNADPSAADLHVSSPSGRFVAVDNVTILGQGGACVDGVNTLTWRGLALAPSAPGATGLAITGTNTTVIVLNSVAQAPAGGGYNAIELTAAATITGQLIVSSSTIISQDPTDALVRIDPAASIPGGSPLPTSEAGVRVVNTTTLGPGSLFASTGLGADDIEVSSFGHLNGPRSNWTGDVRLDTSGAPPDALLDHTGFAGFPRVVPFDNAQNGGVGGTFRELTALAAQARHTLLLGTVELATVNAGGTYTGADGDYTATQASTSGAGTGTTFTVTLTGGTITAVVSIDVYGVGDSTGGDYVVGDTITLDVEGVTETVAAVLDVDEVAWLVRTDGPVDDLVGPLSWVVDIERGAGGAGSTVLGYATRRTHGTGPWVEIAGARSVPVALINSPQRVAVQVQLKDIGIGDEWRIEWVNDVVGSANTLFTIIELVGVGQP